MSRIVISLVVFALLFAGFEAAVDAAAILVSDQSDTAHEVHQHSDESSHTQHDGDDGACGHFCHCGVHTFGLISTFITATLNIRDAGSPMTRHRYRGLTLPPPYHPPIQ